MWLFDRFMSKIVREGELTVIDWDGSTKVYGTPSDRVRPITIRFTEKGAADRLARSPRLGAGEAYMEGRLTVEGDDIMGLLDLVLGNAPWERGGAARGAINKRGKKLITKLDQWNWARRSKRNVAHHYDLSDRLYDLFLDADRQYSCAYFTDPANSLEQAQSDKKAHIAAKLYLKPGLRVLDIGCGWGGMALYLNKVADVDVLGVTLSEEQLKVARQRAADAGVSDRVKFELMDYRDLTGSFDRIVSVGMFEHVGVPQYETFFRKTRDLLTPDGVMLLHTIGRFGGPGITDAWTAKYIFPGGYNPALSQIVAASEKAKMIVSDVETLRLHYAHTLDHWYARTVAASDEIVRLYDERFLRMWKFYLAGAAGGFRYGGICNYQVQYIRQRSALPITRDYMAEREGALRG